jgi:pilus assembly protein CpaC
MGGGGAQGGAGGVASDAGAGVIVNRVRVPGPRQVLLRVKIAELNRTALRQLGVSWLDVRNSSIIGSTVGGAGSIGASSGVAQNAAFSPLSLLPGAINTPIPGRIQSPGFSPVASAFSAGANAATNSATQLFGIFNAGEFNIFINALRTNSLAKILAEPNLVSLDGQPARFQAGGSFPYPVPQAGAGGVGSVITIQYAQFGAILSFIPHILQDDVIRLDVEPNFSELNFAQGFAIPGTGGTVPGINQRNARTVVELREGQTLAIAGLLSTRTNATTSRIPGLGDLPIVGPWFSRNQIETLETELVVLVTPELVEAVDAAEVPPGPGETLLEPNDWEFFFLGRIEGKTGNPHRATVDYMDPLDVMKHHQSEARWVIGPHGHAD